MAPSGSGSRSAGRPARWESTWRSVMSSLPAAPNSGQYRTIGASRSTRPRSTSRCAQTALNALPTEKKSTSVSCRHGRRRRAAAQPPQRSTTTPPGTETATAAPTSPRSTKLDAKASRTAANLRSQTPSMDGGAHAACIADSRCEEPEARRVLPAPLLAEDVGVPRVGDLPGARQLEVAVVVVGADAHRALLSDVEEVVVERPRAARRRLARELDLGMMPVVDGHRPRLPPERLAEEAQDGLRAREAVPPLAVVGGRIVGEAAGELVPELQIEAPPVPVLEALDRLDVLQPPDARREVHERLPSER